MAGANRGIGLNLARALAARNWNVIASVRPQTIEMKDPSVEKVWISALRTIAVRMESDLLNRSRQLLRAFSKSTLPTRARWRMLLKNLAVNPWMCSSMLRVFFT